MRKKALPSTVECSLFLLLRPSTAASDDTISARWRFNAEMSTDLAAWRYREPELEIHQAGDVFVCLFFQTFS